MKERELREHALCTLCGEGIGKGGIPVFWTVKLQYHAVDVMAVSRQQGLTAMLGGSAELAIAMGPDEEMTKPLCEEVEITVCQTCATTMRPPHEVTFGRLMEVALRGSREEVEHE